MTAATNGLGARALPKTPANDKAEGASSAAPKDEVEGHRVPDLLHDWAARAVAQPKRGPALDNRTLRAHATREAHAKRAAVQKLDDPFTVLADPKHPKRRRENILWENDRFLVVMDRFSKTQALVTPKQPAQFPIDLSQRMVDEMSLIAASVGRAFEAAGGAPGEATTWVNPPAVLSLSQLHVHVSAPRPNLRASAPDVERVAAELVRLLGPPSHPRVPPTEPSFSLDDFGGFGDLGGFGEGRRPRRMRLEDMAPTPLPTRRAARSSERQPPREPSARQAQREPAAPAPTWWWPPSWFGAPKPAQTDDIDAVD
jgi:diadenosine tetraphosphate (Ap4A) HIT family hydrolase